MKILLTSFLLTLALLSYSQSEAVIKRTDNGQTKIEFTSNNSNLLIGQSTGSALDNGSNNVSIGDYSGISLANSSENTFLGVGAGNIATGNGNVALGYNAGQSSTGSENIFLGKEAGFSAADKNNTLWINNKVADSTQTLIYGEMTNNPYLRLNARTNISNNLLVKDNIGLGTQDPQYRVDISNSLGSRIRIKSDGDGYFAGMLTENDTRQFFIGTQGTFETANATSGFQIYDNTAGSQRMVIDENGNMGISNSNPTARLDVAGSDGDFSLKVRGKSLITANSSDSLIYKVESSSGENLISVLENPEVIMTNTNIQGNLRASGTTTTNGPMIANQQITANDKVQLSTEGVTFQGNQSIKKATSMRYFIAVDGAFPANGGTPVYDGILIGEIKLFPYISVEPSGWIPCEGQILNIVDYVTLFSLIGNEYGGNGTTTFALPDMREAVPHHAP